MKDVFGGILGVIAIPLGFFVVGFVWWFILRDVNFNFATVFSAALLLLPAILPFVLFYLTYDRWFEFVQTMFKYNNKRSSLRIKLPQEVLKSPEAMESVFAHIHAPNNPDNHRQGFLDGKHRLAVSLELVSIGGDVRFYINVHQKIKNWLESQLYSQYPGIEIEEELLDYTAELQWDPEKIDLMSFHVTKKNDSIYPIKTYIEFGHDKNPKEEEKFEPMAALLEYLSKAKPHERVYIQMLCTPHAKKTYMTGSLKTEGTWETTAKDKINEMMGRDAKRQGAEEETESRPMLTMGERDIIGAIERNCSKPAYDVGIRAMYITTDITKFDATMIAPTFGSFRQFSVLGRNELAPRWKTDFDHAWYEDRSGARKLDRKKTELEEYKKRSYYAGSGKANAGHQPKTMSVEELATIFHLPGTSVLTPGLSRITSNRREAPSNLPIGNLPS